MAEERGGRASAAAQRRARAVPAWPRPLPLTPPLALRRGTLPLPPPLPLLLPRLRHHHQNHQHHHLKHQEQEQQQQLGLDACQEGPTCRRRSFRRSPRPRTLRTSSPRPATGGLSRGPRWRSTRLPAAPLEEREVGSRPRRRGHCWSNKPGAAAAVQTLRCRLRPRRRRRPRRLAR